MGSGFSSIFMDAFFAGPQGPNINLKIYLFLRSTAVNFFIPPADKPAFPASLIRPSSSIHMISSGSSPNSVHSASYSDSSSSEYHYESLTTRKEQQSLRFLFVAAVFLQCFRNLYLSVVLSDAASNKVLLPDPMDSAPAFLVSPLRFPGMRTSTQHSLIINKIHVLSLNGHLTLPFLYSWHILPLIYLSIHEHAPASLHEPLENSQNICYYREG